MPRWWIVLGVACGLGLLTKFSLLFFGAALVVALLIAPQRRVMLTPWPWLAGGDRVRDRKPQHRRPAARSAIPVVAQMRTLQGLAAHARVGMVVRRWSVLSRRGGAARARGRAVPACSPHAMRAFRAVGWTCIGAFVLLLRASRKVVLHRTDLSDALCCRRRCVRALDRARNDARADARVARSPSWCSWHTPRSACRSSCRSSRRRRRRHSQRDRRCRARRRPTWESHSSFRRTTRTCSDGRSSRRQWRTRTTRFRRRSARRWCSGRTTTARPARSSTMGRASDCRASSARPGSYWFFGPGEKPGTVLVSLGVTKEDLERWYTTVTPQDESSTRGECPRRSDVTDLRRRESENDVAGGLALARRPELTMRNAETALRK